MRKIWLATLAILVPSLALAEELDDPDARATLIMISAYQDLLQGRDEAGMEGLKQATALGHQDAPLVLSEIVWTELAGETRFTEALHWALAAKNNGAVDVEILLEALTEGRSEDVQAFFTNKQAKEMATLDDSLFPQMQPRDLKRRAKDQENGFRSVWMMPLKSTTIQIDSQQAGTVLIDGIIAGSSGEVLEIDPGDHDIEFVTSGNVIKTISVRAMVGQSIRIDL